jgi:2-dehydro-3-deoxyphosphooctonate aldolase (KDO 8-P synthase)
MPVVQIGSIVFGDRALPLIAGPCVIESRDHALRLAEAIADIAARLHFPYIFKSSFDKANRTSIHAYRGPGLEEGLRILAEVKTQVGVPVLTDIHLPEQAAPAAEVVDVLQIPAFLCRQTDLLVAAARTGKPVNVKKGQYLSPWKVGSIVEKIEAAGNDQILLTERGTTFGYQGLVTDLRSIPIMQATGYPVVFDATHSAQLPGSAGDGTGGLREYIPTMIRAAVAAGCDGLFLEVHDNVGAAKSDAATQWPLDRLETVLSEAQRIREVLDRHG